MRLIVKGLDIHKYIKRIQKDWFKGISESIIFFHQLYGFAVNFPSSR